MLRFPSLYIVWGNSNAKILEIRTWNGNSWTWLLSWRKRFWEWKRVKEEEVLSEVSLSQNVIDMKIWRPSPNLGKARRELEKLLFKFFYIYLLLEKLINKKHFPVKEKFDLVSRKVFS